MFIFVLFLCSRSDDFSIIKFSKELPPTGIGPEPREFASIAYSSKSNKIYLFGGYSHSYFDDLWTFDLSDLHWAIIYPNSISPTKRKGAAGFIKKQINEFCIFGGKAQGYVLNDMWCFNHDYMMWKEMQQEYKPPPLETFGYKHFEWNGSEFFLIVGNKVFDSIVRSYIYSLNENYWENWIVFYDYIWFMQIYFLYQKLRIDIEVYEDQVIILTYGRNEVNGLIFTANNTSNITSQVSFKNYFSLDGNYLSQGCVLIDHYLYSQFAGNQYLKINIFAPEQENWSFIPITNGNIIVNSPYISINNTLIYFGGYTDIITNSYFLTNSIYQHNIYPFHIESTLIVYHYVSPPNRLAHSFHAVRGKLWLFGGKGKDSLFSDTWSYDPVTDIWTLLNTMNKPPSARSHFASASGADIFIIWGGEDANGLNNDMFLYNVIKNTWTEIFTMSVNMPRKRKGACMVFNVPFAFIYGGMDNNGVCGDLWKYDFRNNEYKFLHENKEDGCAFCTCTILNDSFIAAGGTKADGNMQEKTFKFDIINMKSVSTENYNCSGSEGLFKYFDNFTICIGGHIGFRALALYSTVSFPNSTIQTLTLDVAYSAAFTYYNSSIYYHGGGYYVTQSVLYKDLPLPFFGVINLKDFEVYEGVVIKCSEGFYPEKGVCKICPSGTYSYDSGMFECLKCPKGCYNPYKGATSLRQCYPCEEGTFNDKYGAKSCKICPEGFQCPTGSQKSYDITTKTSEIQSIQPQIYKSAYSASWVSLIQYMIFLVMISIIICAINFEKLKNFIKNIDYYTSLHTHDIGECMQLKKTFIGGIFTVILLGVCTIILVSVFLFYISDNITEIKSLMPLVVLENTIDKFTADFDVIFTLQNYGDSCISMLQFSKVSSVRYCSDKIYVKAEGINTKYESINCSKTLDNNCRVFYKCSNCELDLNSALNLILAEDSSYSTGIIVNITADSSIPESSSSVSMGLSPTPGRIFIGSEASQFYLSVIPSYFTSTISKFPHELTGYHLSPASSPTSGSENFIEDLPVATQLSVKINFNKLSTGLYTSRYQTQSALIFISGLFGTLSGLTGIVGILMSKFEEMMINRNNKEVKKVSLKRIIENQNICKMNFKERGEEKNDSSFHLGFANPTSALSTEGFKVKIPARSVQTSSIIINNWISN